MVSFNTDIKTSPCPSCKTGRIMSSGQHHKYNAKNSEGKIVCIDCKMGEIYRAYRGSNA